MGYTIRGLIKDLGSARVAIADQAARSALALQATVGRDVEIKQLWAQVEFCTVQVLALHESLDSVTWAREARLQLSGLLAID